MSNEMKRRAFFARLAGGAVASVAVGGAVSYAAVQAPAQGSSGGELVPEKWDIAWIDGLKGSHKLMFDLLWHTLRPNSLNPPRNYLYVHKQVFGRQFPDVNVVLGMNSTSFPINASDALWAKLKLGERYKIVDPDTGKPATRNVYLGSRDGARPDSVLALQERGAVFMMCNKSMNSLTNDFAQELSRPRPEMYAELTAGLVTGVKVVPALTWAMSTLQERGFTYAKL
jgi:intracellular sulfur oxidation DsrE/DsrF family protein